MSTKKKIKVPQNNSMKHVDVRKRLYLLREWDFKCVLCGQGFHDISSVTFEHLIPISQGGARERTKSNPNIAPSHYRCNNTRGQMSLIYVSKMLDALLESWGQTKFDAWANEPIPNRTIPKEFLMIGVKRPLGCLDLPELLPGMR